MRQWVGSILFTFFLFATVPIYGTVALLTTPLPRRYMYGVAIAWVESMFWLLRVLCRLGDGPTGPSFICGLFCSPVVRKPLRVGSIS